MNKRKWPVKVQILISTGLLLTTIPTVLKDVPIAMPDFFRGLLVGVGLGLEITGLVLLKTNNSTNTEPTSESVKL